MKIFNFFKSNNNVTAPVVKSNVTDSNLSTFNMNTNFAVPYQEMWKTSRGYLFGIDGLFPQQLNYLYHQSPLHSAILSFKKYLTSGKGFTVDTTQLDVANKIALNQLTNQYDDFLLKITDDYFIHSRICIEVTWNKDFTKLVKLERIAPEKIHINEINEKMQPINYLYNWDWTFYTRYPTKEIAAFDQSNKKDRCQLFVFQIESPGQKLYSEPQYLSALPWIFLDSESAEYHKANICNSINPSLLVQYYQLAETKEQKQQIVADLNQSFAGARKTSRAMVTFADGKELSPSITQMSANQLDKTFLSLTDTIQRQICYSHIIDPQLLGLKTPGSLGVSGSFEYSFQVFNSVIIQPAQREIEKILNKFISINGIGVKLVLNEPDILSVLPPTEQSKMDAKTAEKEKLEKEIPAAVNDNIKGLSAKEHQQLIRVIRQYSKGQITKDVATTLLRTGLGLSEEDINLMLPEIEE